MINQMHARGSLYRSQEMAEMVLWDDELCDCNPLAGCDLDDCDANVPGTAFVWEGV